jgi:pimeloyl-ACP methyl ester carboxylesterase
MTDTVIGEFTYRRKLSGSGPEGLLALARQARSVYRRHPWMLNVSNAGPALEPRLRVHPRKSLAEGFEDGTDADMAPEPLAGIAYHDDGTTAWVDEVAAARFLWQDSKPAVAAWAFPQLQAQYSLWTERCPVDAWPDVESAYILCTEDRLVSPEWPRRAAQAKLGVSALELPGGHSPFLSRPAELAEALCQQL